MLLFGLIFVIHIFFAMSMANLTIGSVNCWGLASDEIKRRDIFHKYKQLYDITFLIDTHCSKEKRKTMENRMGV